MAVASQNGDVEIRELRAFVAVVEDGGLSAAARRLNLSQSALSQTVQSLERQLGVRLLVRTHTGVRATEPGEVLLTEARALVAQHDRAVRAVTSGVGGEAGHLAGVLRVGTPLELPTDLLPSALAQLGTAYPDTRVDVRHQRSAAQLEALRAGGLDLGLVRDRPPDVDLDAVLVVEEAMGVLLSNERAAELADVAGVRLERLSGLHWIGFPRADAPAWHDQVNATMRAHGVPVSAHAEDLPVTAEVKLAAVGTGRAFALASPSWGQPLPGELSWHPLIGSPIVRRTWAVWSAAARQRDLAELIDALDRQPASG
jgi:DNA-binding transcriptional LysR family regulator